MSCCGNNSKKKGEYAYIGVSKDESRSHEKHFRGPIDNRSCTDVICCLIFFIFVLGLFCVIGWAYVFGDLQKIVRPTNSNGQLCGTGELKDRPNLVFFNLFVCVTMGPGVLIFGCPTKQVCVEKCPAQFWTKYSDPIMPRSNMVCLNGKDGNAPEFKSQSIDHLLKTQQCAEYVFPSTAISGRCVPDIVKVIEFVRAHSINPSKNNESVVNDIKKYQSIFRAVEISGKVFDDIRVSYLHIILGLGLGAILSLIYVLLLRFFAAAMVWITIVLFVLVFVIATAISFVTYYFLQNPKTVFHNQTEWLITMRYSNDQFWLGLGISCAIILGIILLLLIFLRERIRIAISIIIMTSKSLVYMLELLFFPIIFFVLQVIVIAGCVLLAFQLASIRTPMGVGTDLSNVTGLKNTTEMQKQMKNLIEKIPCTPGTNTTEGKICTFFKYGTQNYVYVLIAFTVFMLFWLAAFVGALSQITIAGSFASYYFAFRKPADIPSFAVWKSFWRGIRYHLGSLAFGSFILATVQFIRVIFEYLEQKVRAGQQNIAATLILKCCKCCLWCLEKFIKFLNKNAYIMISIYGQNFCSAAMNAFNLLLRNAIRVVVLDKMTDLILFMGRLVVVGIVTTLSVLYFNKIILKSYSPLLHYFYIPIIIIAIGCYIITSIFFSIFEMGADTIFLCFCEDLERNDGSAEKPYFMSASLMKILGKKNEAVTQEGEHMELKN